MSIETTEYTRKPFDVNVVEVTIDKVAEIAEWCNGTVETIKTKVLNTEVDLPCIKIQGVGDAKNKVYTAHLGHFVVELNGSFRTYKPHVFKGLFDKKRAPVYRQAHPNEPDGSPIEVVSKPVIDVLTEEQLHLKL